MIDIVKKTTGECEYVEGDPSNRFLASTSDEDSELNSFCSLSQPQSYLAMYFVMVRTSVSLRSNRLTVFVFLLVSFFRSVA